MIGIVLSGFFLLCLLPTLISIHRGKFDLFEPIVFHSILMFMMGVAIFDRVYLQEPYLRHSRVISMDFGAAFLLVTVLYFVFFALVLTGYYIDITNFVNVPQIYSQDVQHDPKLLKRIGYLYMLLGLIFYILLVRSALGSELLLLFSTTTPRSEIFSDSAHLQLGSRLLHIGYTIWLIAIIANKQRPKVWHLLPILPIVVLFFILGGRGGALGIVVNLIVILYYSLIYGLVEIEKYGVAFVKDRLHFYAKMAVIPIVGVIISVVVLITGAMRQDRSVSVVNIDLVRILTAGVHTDVLDTLIATIEAVPEDFGYYYGTLVFRVLLNWVPRSIWPEKPVLSTGSEFRRVVLPEQSGGRPTGEIGRFYVDLGYPGIIIGALLTGLVLRFLYELLRKNGHSPVFLLVYSVTLFTIAMGGLTNKTLWSSSASLVLLIPLLVADWRSQTVNSES